MPSFGLLCCLNPHGDSESRQSYFAHLTWWGAVLDEPPRSSLRSTELCTASLGASPTLSLVFFHSAGLVCASWQAMQVPTREIRCCSCLLNGRAPSCPV